MRLMRMRLLKKYFLMKSKIYAHSHSPSLVLRDLWIRTQNERAWRRFYILPETTAEIEFNTAENYRNAHFDEEKWQYEPFRIDIPLPPEKRDEADKPVKSPVSKSEFYLVKWCPRPQKILIKTIIFQIRLISTCFDTAI